MRSRQELLDKIRGDIQRRGWSSIGVFPTADDPDHPEFTYTIGLRERGHPELIVYGLPPETAHAVIGLAFSRIEAGERFEDGQRYAELLEQFDVAVKAAPGAPVNVARAYYGTDEVEVLQIVWPDEDDRFPWDEGFDERFRKQQPILAES